LIVERSHREKAQAILETAGIAGKGRVLGINAIV